MAIAAQLVGCGGDPLVPDVAPLNRGTDLARRAVLDDIVGVEFALEAHFVVDVPEEPDVVLL